MNVCDMDIVYRGCIFYQFGIVDVICIFMYVLVY